MKADFPIFRKHKRLVYLDSAATAQKSKVVIDTISSFSQNEYASVHRGLYPLAVSASTHYENARTTVAKFLNSASDEIIFTSGTTQSLNMLAQMLAPFMTKSKNEIVLTEMEHHANLVPWQMIARQLSAKLVFIPITKDYELDYLQAKKLITKKTAIVSAVHVSNTLGVENDVALLCGLAKSVGAYSIIDGAQSVAHQKVDVKKMGCDFFVFSGHKLYGPTGIGVLYGRKAVLETLEPAVTGGNMIESVFYESSTWADIPHRFEAGTTPFVQAIGLAAAIEYIQSKKISAISKHVTQLTQHARKELQSINGVNFIGPKKTSGIISFTLRGIHPHDIADELGLKGICVRGGHHCTMPLHKKLGLSGTTRISFGVYNTKEDVDVFVTELKRIITIYN